MECKIRHWEMEDAPELAESLNNRNIQNNLRDGLPYPYVESDAKNFVKAMLDAIDSGAWPVGRKIPSENSLCKTLSVSRFSVRSALQQYIALGILKSYHGKGTYVLKDDLSIFGLGKTSQDSIYDMEQVLEFRSMIEPEIAANAAKNATPEIVQHIPFIACSLKNQNVRSLQYKYHIFSNLFSVESVNSL